MNKLSKIPQNFFAEDDDAGKAPETDTLTELLIDDDDKGEILELDKPEKEEKEEKEEKDDEEEEKELEIEQDEDDKVEELIVPVSQKKILAKYPNLFKDFPYLEKAYYADQAYKELLPTIDDAKEVIEKAKILDGFEQNLLQGNAENLLKNIKNADEKAFNKIVDNYLPTLAKVDQGAFQHVITTVTKRTIMAMANEAKASGNEELGKAALLLNQFAFGSSQFEPPKPLVNEDPKQDERLQQERAQFVQERFSTAKEDLDSRIHNSLKSTIDGHIDPKNAMTDYVKRNAVREALELTDKVIAGDKEFRKSLDLLWKRAFEQNFNRDSVNRIRSAYLSKAKAVLPQVIQKTRNEALRGLKSRTTSDTKRGIVSPGRPTSGKTENKKPGEIPKGMRTIDFLMQD